MTGAGTGGTPGARRGVSVSVEAELVGRAEAYAASRHTTLEALLERHVADLGSAMVSVPLPEGAAPGWLRMFHHGGRDTTAAYLADGAWDEFERPMPGHFYRWVRGHPGLVVDGGANTGFYALLAAAAGARVVAFEPDGAVRALLEANVAANGLGERIRVHSGALSAVAGRAALFVPMQDHGMIETSSSLEPAFKARFSETAEVETVTVDAVLGAVAGAVVGDAAMGGERVSVVKLDLAGHEAAALEGAEATVARDRPVVFAEVLDRADFGRLSRFVARHNYVDLPLRTAGRLHPQVAVTFERDAWNHALVPAEALPAFLAALRPGL